MVEGKKHRRNFIKKVVVWAFLACFEKGTGRGKQMEDGERKNNKKEVYKDRKMLFGEKSWQRGLRRVSDIWAHVQLNKNTAKGGKMFGCFSWTKKGTHDLLWPKDKKNNTKTMKQKREREKITKKKKTRIGYASLGCSKHIGSEGKNKNNQNTKGFLELKPKPNQRTKKR